jgi:hypothetical protein
VRLALHGLALHEVRDAAIDLRREDAAQLRGADTHATVSDLGDDHSDGHAVLDEGVVDVPHVVGLLLVDHELALHLGIERVAERRTASRDQPSAGLLALAPHGSLGNLRPLVRADDGLDMEEQLALGGVFPWGCQELDAHACALELVHQDHHVRQLARQTVRVVERDQVDRPRPYRIAQRG